MFSVQERRIALFLLKRPLFPAVVCRKVLKLFCLGKVLKPVYCVLVCWMSCTIWHSIIAVKWFESLFQLYSYIILFIVYGWVDEITPDGESASPQSVITVEEGDTITLNIYYTKNGLTPPGGFEFTIETGGNATCNAASSSYIMLFLLYHSLSGYFIFFCTYVIVSNSYRSQKNTKLSYSL